MQLPYVRLPPPNPLANPSSLQGFADKLASLCGTQRLTLPLDNAATAALAPSSDPYSSSSEPGSKPKRVLSLSVPPLTETAGARRRSVAEHGACSPSTPHLKKLTGTTPVCSLLPEVRLANELEEIGRAYPRHLVILAGSRRQEDPAPVPSPAPPAGGILARYQLLTPALITGLLIVVFLLVPIVLFGVSALASIQSPLRVQPPKGFSADEKKNQ